MVIKWLINVVSFQLCQQVGSGRTINVSMSDEKKPKSSWSINWRLLLVVVILVSLITVGDFRIYPSVINIVKNLDGDWTGFGETQVITTNTEKDQQGQIQKTTISEPTHSGKTFWDWLELGSRLAVPILLFFFGYQFQQRDKKRAEEQERLEKERAEEQAKLERGIAQDNLAEEAIQNYLDSMDKLLLDKELKKELFTYDKLKSLDNENNDNPVGDVARIITITILRRLENDRERQARIIHFLRDAELSEFILKNANLSGINLSQANLMSANLQEANLMSANLQGADLIGANLQGADLIGANLQGADLIGANLQSANLRSANLQGADLRSANLQSANLRSANLQKADLIGANLQEADLRETNLQKVDLIRANPQEVDLKSANLQEANLGEVKDLNHKQIKSACFWSQAIYKSKWNKEKKAWEAKEGDNSDFIKQLQEDTASNPKEPVDCSRWSR